VQQHKGRFSVEHPEGADVGYRWFAKTGKATLFPFGFGLSYTGFGYGGLAVDGGETLTVSLDVTNTGAIAGIDTPQVYALVSGSDGKESQRLIGWSRVALAPGETKRVKITADPRLLANYDVTLPGWRIAEGSVGVAVGPSAEALLLRGEAKLSARTLKP
jgi:beta-glucosidase